MEHHPEDHEHEAAPTRTGITAELLRSLPPIHEGAGVITAALADQVREDYFNARSESKEITPETARAVAYSLAAHAPDNATTTALERYASTGEGQHEELRAEYLPLAEDPIMPAEGRLLLDALGTHLFRQEHPQTVINVPRGALTTYALDGGLFYTEVTGERVAVAFQLPMGLATDEHRGLMNYLERNVARYGDPFRAFLRLPGIDATAPGLITQFLRMRMHPELAARTIAGTLEPPRTGGAMPAWEGVEIGGQIHVFTR